MRFFKFDSYGAILADNSRNRNYIPTIQKQSLPTPCEMNMNFVVGRPNIDYSDSATVAAMDDLIAELKSTEDDGSDVRLTGFGLKVTSSPEGSFETNKKLAGQRAVFAANAVLNNLSRATRNGIQNDFGRTAEVAPWSAMVELLRKDSLVEEANAVQAILDEIPGTEGYDMDRQGVRIKKLPFYYPVIADRLVKLRKVEYLIVTETWREFTDEELLDWFKAGKLSRLHETRDIWRLSHLVDSLDQKEQILRYGMDVAKRKYGTASPAAYATHAVFANDLAAIMIDQKKSDVAILKEYVDTLPKAGLGLVPEEIWANQAVAYMAKKGRSNYLKAADYLNRIGANRFDESEYLHRVGLYLRALLGDYEDGLAEIAAERPMNEVALLLEWEQDALAWEKAQKLDDSADAFYLRAIAARRMADSTDDFAMQDMASENLARAIMLNPAYEKLAAIDGDVLKILPYAQNFIAEIKEKERFEALAAAEEADLESAQIEMEAEDIALQAKSDAMDMGATEEEATAIGQKAAQEYREQKAKEREERLAAEKNRRRSTKTAEEIAEVRKAGKEVMIFFSKQIDPDIAGMEQVSKLQEYKNTIEGLYETFQDLSDFEKKFSQKLNLFVQNEFQPLVAENVSNSKGEKTVLFSEEEIEIIQQWCNSSIDYCSQVAFIGGHHMFRFGPVQIETENPKETAKFIEFMKRLEAAGFIEFQKFDNRGKPRYSLTLEAYERFRED